MVQHDLQHLLHHLGVGDVVTEETQFGSEPSDAVHEIFYGLPLLLHQGAKLTSDLLRVRLTHALDPDAHPLDHLPHHHSG
jgi:hypothetical protein